MFANLTAKDREKINDLIKNHQEKLKLDIPAAPDWFYDSKRRKAHEEAEQKRTKEWRHTHTEEDFYIMHANFALLEPEMYKNKTGWACHISDKERAYIDRIIEKSKRGKTFVNQSC